ncbi:hypothetical protein [Actinokineospora sp.]|uniref:hypothetical protein n=1 Tax=Actinokineospora sp. TaxID=1872133 RepID=UPI00403835F6
MHTALKVGAWVTVGKNCDMKYVAHNHDDIDFVFGNRSDSFEFAFNEHSLTRFVALATRALTDAKTMREAEDEAESAQL